MRIFIKVRPTSVYVAIILIYCHCSRYLPRLSLIQRSLCLSLSLALDMRLQKRILSLGRIKGREAKITVNRRGAHAEDRIFRRFQRNHHAWWQQISAAKVAAINRFYRRQIHSIVRPALPSVLHYPSLAFHDSSEPGKKNSRRVGSNHSAHASIDLPTRYMPYPITRSAFPCAVMHTCIYIYGRRAI